MANQEYLPLFPRRTRWLWWPSALAGAAALGLTYGFIEPVVADQRVYQILVAAGALFVLSRVMLLLPPVEIPARVGHCWLDFAVLLAGAVWWALDHAEREVLEIIAGYSAASGFVAAVRGGVGWLTDGPVAGIQPGPVRRLFLAGFFMAIIGGLILSLPRCWAQLHPVSMDESYAGQWRYNLGMHGLNCLFTATSALTGTGLSVHDIGRDFNLAGQIVILLLMQIGGFAILAVGTALGLRLRAMLGWQTHQDDSTPQGLRRAIQFSWILLLTLELIGAAAIFFSQSNLFETTEPLAPKILGAVFDTVSAVCNVGLTLNGDQSMVNSRYLPTTYAVILPLMVLGSIGGPTLYSLYRKLRDRGTRLPVDVWLTLGATALLIVVGAGLLYGVESSYDWQLRHRQEKTLGSLQWNGTTSAPAGGIVFSSDSSDKAASQRLRTMTPAQRITAALFQSISARTCGLRTARIDEQSLSPASHLTLMAWMLIGGSVGGTAGGLRLCVVGLLLAAILRPGWRLWRTETYLDAGAGRRAVAAAGVTIAAMALLIVLTAFVLTYRQSASPENCLFESISACTNTGLSTGLADKQLPHEDSGPVWLRCTGRGMLVLAMIFGRVLPMGILLRWMHTGRDN